MWEGEWWKLYEANVSVKEQLRESLPYKRPLRQDQFLDKRKPSALFGYVQYDIKFPEHLRQELAFFRPFFKNTNVCRQDLDPLMQEYVEKKEFLSQKRRMLNFKLWTDQWKYKYSLTTLIVEVGTRMHENSSLRWVNHCE